MTHYDPRRWRGPVALSLLLHIVLILSFAYQFDASGPPPAPPAPETIKAVAVNSARWCSPERVR